jgi:hypothetical protein
MHQQLGVEMAFGSFKFKGERAKSKLVRKDRQDLEAAARRFLESYLAADEDTKPRFYRIIEDTVQECQIEASVVRPSPELEDAQIAMAMSNAATAMYLRAMRPKAENGLGKFSSDAYATVAVEYRRAAGIYTEHRDMRELGTAAVHRLTMATSYLSRPPSVAPVET